MSRHSTQNLVDFLCRQSLVQSSVLQAYVGGLLGYIKLKDPDNYQTLKNELDARLFTTYKDNFQSSSLRIEYSDKVVKEFVKGIPDVKLQELEKV